MLVNYIALLPELMLSIGILTMFFVRLFRSSLNTAKTFFTLTKWTLLPTSLLTMILYNKNVENYILNNSYTTLFKLIIYTFTFWWSWLSLKRFQNRNMIGFVFYFLILINLLGFSVAISSCNLGLTAAALIPCQILNYFLFQFDADEEKRPIFNRYLLFAGFFSICFIMAVYFIYYNLHSLNYEQIENYLQGDGKNLRIMEISFMAVMVFFLFSIGVAPFHFWFAKIVSATILPVCGYITIIPVFAYFSCMTNLLANCFSPMFEWFMPVFLIFGSLSILFGAVGANSVDNLRRIFAYSNLYYIGVTLITLSDISSQNLLSGFIYLLVYVLAAMGVYTVFFGIRSKGSYLQELNDIKGFSTQQPLLSAILLIFMISLIGTPPLIGFLGKLSVMNALVIDESYILMLIVAFSMLILVHAYLKIITVIYFEPRNIIFDRVDKGVYICLSVNILLIVITVLNPKYLIYDIEKMLTTIL